MKVGTDPVSLDIVAKEENNQELSLQETVCVFRHNFVLAMGNICTDVYRWKIWMSQVKKGPFIRVFLRWKRPIN